MTFHILVALVSAVWLLSCGASALALYWNVFARAQRCRAAFASSCVALLIAYGGLSRVRLSASKTVNGIVEWSVDSRWFFTAALIFGAAALALSLWTSWRSSSRLAAASLEGEVPRTSGPAAVLQRPLHPPTQRTGTASIGD